MNDKFTDYDHWYSKYFSNTPHGNCYETLSMFSDKTLKRMQSECIILSTKHKLLNTDDVVMFWCISETLNDIEKILKNHNDKDQ